MSSSPVPTPPSPAPPPSGARAAPAEPVLRKAQRQHGIVTRQDLVAAGHASSTITRLVHRGILQRMHQGVYHAGLRPTWKSGCMAAVLAAGPGAVLSHTSAARVWGLLPEGPERRIHVTIPPDRAAARPGLRIHRARVDSADRTTRDRIPVTTPARTLVDLSGLLSAGKLEQVMARAARDGLTRRRAVRASADRRRIRVGRARLRKLLAGESGPAFTRSEAEALLLRLVREAELPAPATNARIERWEVDFLWAEARLVVEVDGFRWHGPRESFEQDRLKDQWLESRGYRVVRITWRQLRDHPLRTVATLARVLGEG